MKVSNEPLWCSVVDANAGNLYGRGVTDFAERWADAMEAVIESGESLEDCALRTSHEADTDGITGFMFGQAVRTLAECWEHGEQLLLWHNRRHGVDSTDGVVNPALYITGGGE